MNQRPTVGRIVHYWRAKEDGEPDGPMAAMVTEVRPDGLVNLAVYEKAGYSLARAAVAYSEEPKAYRWSWPKYAAPDRKD